MGKRNIDSYLDQAETCWVTALTRVSDENFDLRSGCQ